MSTSSADTRGTIGRCIATLLNEHVERPYHNLREADPQARLWELLRQELRPATVDIRIVSGGRERPNDRSSAKTSRVHLEMRLGLSHTEVSDIIVFHGDRQVHLECRPGGPTDVIAALRPEDVEAVIEVKAAPSRNAGERRKFAKDVCKLAALQAKRSAIQVFSCPHRQVRVRRRYG